MSNHKDSLVKVLEYLVNEDNEKASDLLHTVFVEKAKAHWASLTENDESVEDDIHEEDLDETYDLDEVEEGIDSYDAEEDFLDDIESAKDEIDSEEIYDDEDMDDAEDDLATDMEVDMGDIGGDDMEGGDMEDDMEGDDMEGDSDAEEALANVEDAIAELRAAFADIMGGDMDDDMADDEVMPFEESAELKKVSVTHSEGNDAGAKSPVGPGDDSLGEGTPVNFAGGSQESGGSAPSAQKMNVKGPQDHGAKLSSAPTPKKENTKPTSESPLRGKK
jgi:hypothetical protein